MRFVPPFAAAVLVLVSAFAVVPGVNAQQATEAFVTDPTNDVVIAAGVQPPPAVPLPEPTPLPAPLPAGMDMLGGPVDLTEVKVYGETATDIWFSYNVQSFFRANSIQPAQITHKLCFAWDGSGGNYQFIMSFSYPTTPNTEVNTAPLFQGGYLERLTAPCNAFFAGVHTPRITHHQFLVLIDEDAGTVNIQITRKLLEQLNPNIEQGELDVAPKAGQKITDIHMFATARAGPSNFYYDATGTFEYTFNSDTGNELLKVIVPQNIMGSYGIDNHGTPMYGVEIGSFQTVPVTIENYLDVPIEPNITVTSLAGAISKWQVRTLASIPIAAKVGDQPGRETVTLIVNSDPTVVHKEFVKLLVTARDAAQPLHLGAAIVDVVAVKPPTAGEATLYFHGTGDPCNTNQRWMNTLSTDASGLGTELAFQGCNPQGGGPTDRITTNGEVGRIFHADVPFARNYVFDTTQPARASIVLKSVVRIPGSTDVDLPVTTVADVTVRLFSSDELIGEATLLSQQIPGEATTFDVPVNVQGRILGGFGREVPNDRPLNVQVIVSTQDRTIEYGGFCLDPDQPATCIPEGEQDVDSPTGKVFMSIDGSSKVVLPIVSSERSGDIINITSSGAFISLRLSQGERLVFTNPGKTVVYNVTVRNEGVNVDTAKVTAEVNQTGWGVQILPVNEYRLRVGQPRVFNVKVTAPEGAREGTQLGLTLVATSTVDPLASARLPLTVHITTQQQFENQEVDAKLQDVEKTEKSPGLSPFVFVLAALAAVVAVARRRRL